MLATIRKEFRFEAAHQLPGHKGKCRDLHGHSYRVEVSIRGEVKTTKGASDEGMVVDFGDLNDAWDSIFDVVDHQFLNDILPVRTTAENISAWILSRLRLRHHFDVAKVRVWETAKCYAEVWAQDVPKDFPYKYKTLK